jgi:hypothetical protein
VIVSGPTRKPALAHQRYVVRADEQFAPKTLIFQRTSVVHFRGDLRPDFDVVREATGERNFYFLLPSALN